MVFTIIYLRTTNIGPKERGGSYEVLRVVEGTLTSEDFEFETIKVLY